MWTLNPPVTLLDSGLTSLPKVIVYCVIELADHRCHHCHSGPKEAPLPRRGHDCLIRLPREKNQFPKPYCWYKHKHDFKFNLLSPFFGANKFDHREMNAINSLPPEITSIGLVLCSTWTKSLTFRS